MTIPRLLAVALLLTFAASSSFAAKLVFEAETATLKPSMRVIADRTASGGKAIEIPLRRPHAATETGPGDAGYASVKIKVAQTGTYQFWGRCWWYDACGNSFYVLIDSTTISAKTPYVTDQTFKKWHWVAGPSVRLTAGVHTIRIQNREDGVRMDQFLLTTTPRNRWEPTSRETATPQYLSR